MLWFTYKLWKLLKRDTLGGTWLPMPKWLYNVLKKYPPRKQVHAYAQLLVGTDLSYIVDNEVACAEVVSRILYELYFIPRIITGTWTLNDYMFGSIKFERVSVPQAGDIIISPTGKGNGKLSNGHVGIIDINNRIISNDSYSGKLTRNFTIKTWEARYKTYGGFPVYYYRVTN